MKKITLFYITLFVSAVFAQRKNVYVEYSLKIYEEKRLMESPSEFRSLFTQAMSNAPNLCFGLLINASGSKFYDVQEANAIKDFNGPDATLVFADYSGISYQFENAIYSQSFSLGKGIILKEELKKNWELHNETKIIDGYLCYKATNIDRVENGTKVFNHPVTAWYCPKLPYAYGPNGYSNLPGLILELHVRNVVYGVKKIDLNSSLDFDPAFLKTIKTISEEALNKRIQEEYDELERDLNLKH